MKTKFTVLLLASGLPMVAFGQNAIGTGQVTRIYREHCAVCHGNDLKGGLGGPLVGLPHDSLTDAELTRWIEEGAEELGMPGFKETLSANEIRSLVIYLREMQRRNRLEAGTSESKAQPESAFSVETVVDGLRTPWAMAWMPDQSMLITERNGSLRHYVNGELRPPVKGTPKVWAHGQGGLLDVALHPDYAENGWVYLAFSEESQSGRGSTAIARGRIKDNAWVDQEWIFRVPPEHHSGSGVHFGTRMVFKDGFLFFAIGDRGMMNSAQDPKSPNGRVHRVRDDGRIPEDNPFHTKADYFPTSWTLGNRNIQGLALHPQTGDLWAAEHGPRGGDEINKILPGKNYGWPLVTHGMNYDGSPITAQTSSPGLEPPRHYWTPSIAVCGINFYNGDAFPDWKYSLLAGGLASEQLHLLTIDENGVILTDNLILKGTGRIRTVTTGPNGNIYLVLNSPDQIVKLTPKLQAE